MIHLPTPPGAMSHDDVTVVFKALTDGDESKGFVPGYHFVIINNKEEEVGHLNFRVGDTNHVRYAAGHIGFVIAPEHRGHRYAAKSCLAAANWISEISGSVLITVDPDNISSIRTIEMIGAVFQDEVDVPPGDPHFSRGSFRKRRYLWEPTRREQLGPG